MSEDHGFAYLATAYCLFFLLIAAYVGRIQQRHSDLARSLSELEQSAAGTASGSESKP
ncbi:MAG: hypothetical protein VX733_08650 [Candidatus Latescibacterota bacterium]|nr:hypothetical protein [Candidatus Latescibacterota bacterium]